MGAFFRNCHRKAFTAMDLLIGVGVLAILTAVSTPLLVGVIANYRFNLAASQIVADGRLARYQAISTGWEYRVYGYNAASATRPNQYRIEGRNDSSGSWPAATSGVFKSADQEAGPWSDIGASYPGVRVNEGDAGGDFWVSFNAQGAGSGISSSFQPLRVKGSTGALRSIQVVLATGSVKAQ